MVNIVSPQFCWFILGIILVLLEFIVPGVILVFFGIGALLTAVLTWMNILPTQSSQLIFFGVSSIALLFGFRKYLSRFFRGDVAKDDIYDESDEYRGKTARVIVKILPDSPDGRILFNGTEWKAVSDRSIEAGALVELVEKENITYTVKHKQ